MPAAMEQDLSFDELLDAFVATFESEDANWEFAAQTVSPANIFAVADVDFGGEWQTLIANPLPAPILEEAADDLIMFEMAAWEDAASASVAEPLVAIDHHPL